MPEFALTTRQPTGRQSIQIVNPEPPAPGAAVRPPSSIAHWLAPGARSVLLDLQQRRDDNSAALRVVASRVNDLITEKVEADAEVKRLQTGRGSGGFGLDDSDVRVRAAKAKIAELSDEIARQSAIRESKTDIQTRLGRLVDRTEKHLHSVISGSGWSWSTDYTRRLPEAPAITPTLLDGENVAAAIQRHRDDLKRLANDVEMITRAPLPIDEAKAKMKSEVEKIAARGKPSARKLVRHRDASISWGQKNHRFDVFLPRARDAPPSEASNGFAVGAEVDSFALLVFLARDEIIEMLDRELDECAAADGKPLTDTERKVELAAIAAEVLRVERCEVTLIEQAAKDGLVIEHRTDVDVRALLHLSDGCVAR